MEKMWKMVRQSIDQVKFIWKGKLIRGAIWKKKGWVKGFEPSTTASTVRRSAIELHPPRKI
jgi:hypothetical protein